METQIDSKPDPRNLIKNLYLVNPLAAFVIVMLPWSVGFFMGEELFLPLITAIPAGLILIKHLRNRDYSAGIIDMTLYVIWLTVIGLILMYFFPAQAEKTVLRGTEYLNEMTPWLMGAQVKENTPSMFIPEHLKHMVIVAIASILSAGMIGLLFGTVLMNYMNYYVAMLMLNSSNPVLMVIIGWHPWSIFRVVSFIILGVACGSLLINFFSGFRKPGHKTAGLLILISIALEIIDILLKTYINEFWRNLIVANLDSSILKIIN